MTIDHEDLIAEARRIVPGVALSVQDLIPDGEARHGCIISDATLSGFHQRPGSFGDVAVAILATYKTTNHEIRRQDHA